MSSEKLPVITDELIFALDQIFPNRHPDLSLSDREVWYRAGQRFVVDYLIEQQTMSAIKILIWTILLLTYFVDKGIFPRKELQNLYSG